MAEIERTNDSGYTGSSFNWGLGRYPNKLFWNSVDTGGSPKLTPEIKELYPEVFPDVSPWIQIEAILNDSHRKELFKALLY